MSDPWRQDGRAARRRPAGPRDGQHREEGASSSGRGAPGGKCPPGRVEQWGEASQRNAGPQEGRGAAPLEGGGRASAGGTGREVSGGGQGPARPWGPPAALGPRWRRVERHRQPGCIHEKRKHRDIHCAGDHRAGNSDATCLQGPAHLQAPLQALNSSPSHPHPSTLPPWEKARARGLRDPPKCPAELQPNATLPRGPCQLWGRSATTSLRLRGPLQQCCLRDAGRTGGVCPDPRR